jgi:hypothetical protein
MAKADKQECSAKGDGREDDCSSMGEARRDKTGSQKGDAIPKRDDEKERPCLLMPYLQILFNGGQ